MHYAVVKSRPWMPYGMERSEINSGSIQIGCTYGEMAGPPHFYVNYVKITAIFQL